MRQHIRLMIKGYREEAEREAFNRGIPFEFVTEVLEWVTILKVQMAYQQDVVKWFLEDNGLLINPTGTLLYYSIVEGET